MSHLHELFRAESAAMLSLYGGSAPGCWLRELGRGRAWLDALRLASVWGEQLDEFRIALLDGGLWGETLSQVVARGAPAGGAAGALQSRAGHAPAPRANPSPPPSRAPGRDAHTARRTAHMPPDAGFVTSRDPDTQGVRRRRGRRGLVEAARARRTYAGEPQARVGAGATRPVIPGALSAHAQGGEASLPRVAPPDKRRRGSVNSLSGERGGTNTPDVLGLNRDVAAALGGDVSRVSGGLRAECRAGTAAGRLVWEDRGAHTTRDGGDEYSPRSSPDVSMLPLMADQALLSRLRHLPRLHTRPHTPQSPPEPPGSSRRETKGSPVDARTHQGAAPLEMETASRVASTAKPVGAAGSRSGRLAETAGRARWFTHAPAAQAKAPLRRPRPAHSESRAGGIAGVDAGVDAGVVAGGAWLDAMFVRMARAMWRPREGVGAPHTHDHAAISRQRSLPLGGPEATRDLLLRVMAQAARGAAEQGASRGVASQNTQPGATAGRVDVTEGRRPAPRNGDGLSRGPTHAVAIDDEPVNTHFKPRVTGFDIAPRASTFEVAPLLTLPPFQSDGPPTLPALLGDEPQAPPVAVPPDSRVAAPPDSRGAWAAQPPEAEDLDALAEKIKLIFDEQARRHGIDV